MANQEQISMLEAIVGRPVCDSAAPQFALSESFSKSVVHYERFRKHVELHIEPQKPSPANRALANFLRDNLPNNEIASVEERDFCYFAYKLKEKADGWDDIVAMGNAFRKLMGIVEPYLKKYFASLNSVFAFAHELAQFYEGLKNSEPYHINVIDELHATENAHSRILVRLLQYFNGKRYSILDSFVSMIPNWDEQDITIQNPEIKFNSQLIDALIEEKGKYAIIIENKIHGAIDQEKQIERYVDTAISHGTPSDKIWALYITKDGSKTVSDSSLTPKVEAILKERFIPINYRDNILPWLKNTVLPNCPEKEEWLSSALKQYIDHLEGLFQTRLSAKATRNQLVEAIKAKLNVNTADSVDLYQALMKENEQLEAVHQIINGEIMDLEKVAFSSFDEITKSYFQKKSPKREFNFIDSPGGSFYQIFPKDWFWGPHLEWVPFNHSDLITEKQISLRLHIEDTKKPRVQKLISYLLDDEDFNSPNHAWFKTHTAKEYFTLTMNLKEPFIVLTQAEQSECLTKIYEDAFAIIPIIDKYIKKGEIV